MRSILAVLLLVIQALTLPARAQEIPRLEPGSKDAQPLTVYQWTAAAGATDEHAGYRFTWRLPKEFDPTEPCDLVVVCHGRGQDYLWGSASLKPEEFGADKIVVCVDGTAEVEGESAKGREFRCVRRDAIDFRDFVLETSNTLPVDRIFLYGHESGSAFTAFMASVFPGIIAGIVADATPGPWTAINLSGGLQSVPVAILYGTADPKVPHYQSLAARDALRSTDHQMFLARAIQDGDHRPSARRASECIDWCSGMSATRADTALKAAEALMHPMQADDLGRTTAPPLGAAQQVLRRVTLETEFHVEEADDEQKAKAKAMIERIDAEGARHVEALKKDVKSAGDLILGLGADGGAWLGHLVTVRETMRGVPSVEAYIKEINYDGLAKEQAEAAAKLVDVWFATRPDKYRFEVVTNNLGECFLVDTLPSDLGVGMAALKAKAAELGLTDESLEKYGMVEAWTTAWQNGYKRYIELCKGWK